MRSCWKEETRGSKIKNWYCQNDKSQIFFFLDFLVNGDCASKNGVVKIPGWNLSSKDFRYEDYGNSLRLCPSDEQHNLSKLWVREEETECVITNFYEFSTLSYRSSWNNNHSEGSQRSSTSYTSLQRQNVNKKSPR